MLVFGHISVSALGAGWVDRRVDLRWVIFFGLAADLLDKPIGLFLFRDNFNSGRLYFHSLVVNLLLTLMLILLRRPLVYSLALWLHQLCDLMWSRPWVALWPFAGSFGYRDLPLDQWVSLTLGPFNLTTEAAGCLITIWFVHRHRLYEVRRLLAWLRTGMVSPVLGYEGSRVRELDAGFPHGLR